MTLKATRTAAPNTGESGDVTARVYHTENGNEHLEGETYAVTDKALLETLRGIGFVTIEGWTEGGAPPSDAPVLASLSPATAMIGAASFTLSVRGTGFVDGAVIVFADHDEPTTVVSPGEVTTGVDMAVWLGPDTVPVVVRGPEGGVSNALAFTFVAAGTQSAGRR